MPLLYSLAETFRLILVLCIFILCVYCYELVPRQGQLLVAVSVLLLFLMPSVQVPDEDGDRRVQEGLEEGGVEIDDGEDPVKWIDDDSDDFKDLI